VAAVERLTKHDFARLRAAARVWFRDLRLDTVIADADDLVADAIFRTTSGQRTWKADVSFMKHLRGVMKSLADSARKSAERRAASGRTEVRESELLSPDAELSDDDEAMLTPVNNAPSGEPGTERALLGSEDIRAFEDHFAGDEVASAVIHGMWMQMKEPEIRKEWDLTKKQVAAAVRRIRRFAHGKGGSHGP
jgi:DNA-directed RNA polymerase specialized sigma24 family protein